MSRTLGRARWWLMAALGTLGLFGAVTLGAESVAGTAAGNSTTLLEVIIVGLGGWGLLAIVQLKQTATQLLMELRGANGRGGLVQTVEDIRITVEGLNASLEGVKRWMPTQEEHRAHLGQSVSRLDGTTADLTKRVERVEQYLEEVSPALGHPFAYPPDAAFHQHRERDAG